MTSLAISTESLTSIVFIDENEDETIIDICDLLKAIEVGKAAITEESLVLTVDPDGGCSLQPVHFPTRVDITTTITDP